MRIQRFIQFLVMAAVIAAMFGSAGAAAALTACGTSYIVKPGDSLGAIARRCGTTVAALRRANPNLGQWIYAGQSLLLPGAFVDNGNGYATYIVARGDTLRALAARFGTATNVLGSLNGLTNYNLIYEGQRLSVPSGYGFPSPAPQPVPAPAGTYVVQWGDTMRKIAARMDVSLGDLLAVNPQISNPDRIFFGQVVNIPASASTYSVQRGDTLRIIAGRFGTSIDSLLTLNPQIWNANWIYAGQVIRIR
ncbi:MAG TPA: LysM peptidoglycan-binding domain-containing protein [Anaerolineales bacterium]